VLGLVRRAFEFLSDKVKENREGLDVFIAIALKLARFVRDTVAPILGGILATAFNLVVRAVGLAIDNFAKVFEIIGKVARFLGFDFSLEVGKATKTVNNLNTGTVDAYKSFAEQSRTIKQDVVPALNTVVTSQNAVAASTNKTTKEINEQTKASAALAKIKKELADDPTGVKTVAAARAARAASAGQLSEFELRQLQQAVGLGIADILKLTTALGGTGQSFGFGDQVLNNAAVNDLISRGLGGLTPGQLQASAQGMGQFIGLTVNVNGTVLDAEGVARAIQDVIQQSNARSGTQSFTPPFGVE
jgi:hypothetical protein